jgi:RNA polymerase sigma-70 factor (ECF subfamily)
MAEMSEINVLIKRWQAGDERVAETIYNRYWDSTFGLAYTLLDDPADAEEVAQDALTYALTRIERYDPGRAKFSTWLHTITVSRCRDKLRRNRIRDLPGLSLFSSRGAGSDVPDTAPSPEQRAIQEATHNEVWEAIATLSLPLREAVVLRHWADYTYQEIGVVLGCSMRTAQSRVRLAYKRLEAILAQNDLTIVEQKTNE